MWKGIHPSFKPAQAYRHHHGEKPLFWPQLVLIVAPVSIGKTQDGAHKKFFFQVCLDVVSTFQYEHIVHLDFSLVGFGLLSAVEKLTYVSSRLWVW